MDMILAAKDLAYGWSPASPLGRGLGLSIAAGEVACVLGPNGEGKTTLFRTLVGLLQPLAGQVTLLGDDLRALARAEIARRVAVVPQSLHVAFPYAVEDFVLMGRTARLSLFATPSRADRRAAARILDELGIAHLARRPCSEVSGGERQLALLARALLQEPRAVVLDEPTASLDYGNQVKALSMLRALADRGLAVLFSTHDPAHAFLVADRVLLLHRGGFAAVGAPREAITPRTLQLLYGVEADIVDLPDGRVACAPRLHGGQPGSPRTST
jgi:iron complex transport system ATP-binding protein